ncbi:azurin [Methylobacillus rhizosphaerae]|uniref:Azurin n=1 Tax=Methylobacillus rhizosphaerae TaxID=551994 RepID=A0A238Z8J3_9PROT|nr:azurin [Methylobacillus rhizosphaerae]SNR79442.1 azurin [Methylobacillus rhizosphaerae]
MRSYVLFSLLMAPALAFANNCEVNVSAGDSMSFNVRSIDVPKSCKEFTVNFAHTGTASKAGMGHNWVLAKTSDVTDVAKAGMEAGIDKNYLPENDARVLAFTPLLGGGEKASVKFNPSIMKDGEAYSFFCSFAFHSFMMRGTVKLVD